MPKLAGIRLLTRAAQNHERVLAVPDGLFQQLARMLHSNIVLAAIAAAIFFLSGTANSANLNFGVTQPQSVFNGASAPFWPVSLGVCRLLGGIALNWDNVNPAKGTYNFTNIDKDVTACGKAGAATMISVGYTPAWASSNPSNSNCKRGYCSPPSDLNPDGSCTESGGCGDSYFAIYVKALCAHLKANRPGAAIILEMWNEPNAGGVGSNSKSWAGTFAQLVSMERTAASIAHSYGYKICSAPPGGMSDTNSWHKYRGPLWFSQFTASGGGQYSDYIGIHCYTNDAVPTGSYPAGNYPEYIRTIAANALSSMAAATLANGTRAPLTQPLWNTESGWGRDTILTDEDQRAAYAARWALVQPGSGISFWNWYAYLGTGWGTLYENNALNKAGVALQTVMGWLKNGSVSTATPLATNSSGSVWTATIQHGATTSLIVWDTSTQCSGGVCPAVSFTLPKGNYGAAHDLAGNVSALHGNSVQISSKPQMFDLAGNH